jgi:putative SOS response-associated peptidase YedK
VGVTSAPACNPLAEAKVSGLAPALPHPPAPDISPTRRSHSPGPARQNQKCRYVVSMCSHYQAIKERERYLRYFGVPPPGDLGKVDLWPGYLGVFIRRHPHADVGDEAVPPCEAPTGLFGLVPHWSLDTRITKHTFNARSETVAVKPSFREAWKHGQHCVVPADAFFEPDWRSGRAIPTKITRADGEPLGIAGLWSWWKSSKGEGILSYTMLTINADDHPMMRQFHKSTDEKRMVVILPPERYQDWLEAPAVHSMTFMRPVRADELKAITVGSTTAPV